MTNSNLSIPFLSQGITLHPSTMTSVLLHFNGENAFPYASRRFILMMESVILEKILGQIMPYENNNATTVFFNRESIIHILFNSHEWAMLCYHIISICGRHWSYYNVLTLIRIRYIEKLIHFRNLIREPCFNSSFPWIVSGHSRSRSPWPWMFKQH